MLVDVCDVFFDLGVDFVGEFGIVWIVGEGQCVVVVYEVWCVFVFDGEVVVVWSVQVCQLDFVFEDVLDGIDFYFELIFVLVFVDFVQIFVVGQCFGEYVRVE